LTEDVLACEEILAAVSYLLHSSVHIFPM